MNEIIFNFGTGNGGFEPDRSDCVADKKRGSKVAVTVAAILGGLALFMVLFALCLGFFMT